MYTTFILVTQEAEKLGAKHRPIFFETPCIIVTTALVCYIHITASVRYDIQYFCSLL